MAAAMGIGRFAYTPLLPQMADEFGWSFALAGDVASANFLGYMVGALLAPKIANSPQVRLWVAFSLMASVVTTYLGAEIQGYVLWMGLRFCSGVASALCLVIVTTNLIYVLTEERSERLGNVHFAGVGVGILFCMAAVFGEGDVAQQWARLGLLAAIMMALAWFLLADQPFRTQQSPAQAEGATNVDATLWRLIVGYGFFGYGYVVAATFVVAMAQRIDAPGFDARTVWLVVGIALVPSVYVWQWVANRLGLLNALRAAYLVEAAGVLMAGVSESYAWLVVACVLLGGTFAAITALGLSAARFAAPQRIAFAVSAMTVAFALGQLLGPAISGRMADVFGDFFWPSIIAAALLTSAAVLVRGQREAHTPR
jgi:predicted MFS family arabinose efflux permease